MDLRLPENQAQNRRTPPMIEMSHNYLTSFLVPPTISRCRRFLSLGANEETQNVLHPLYTQPIAEHLG